MSLRSHRAVRAVRSVRAPRATRVVRAGRPKPGPSSPRPGSLSLFAVSGLAVGGLALTGVTSTSTTPTGSVTGDRPAAVTTIDGFDLSWQVADQPGAAVPDDRPLVRSDDRALVRSDVAYVAEALADIDLTPELAYEGADGERIDPARIRVWLEDRNSPMAPYSEELVAAGIDHDVDPRLVVGIAAIESSAGKRLPPGSHNAWGWNGSGAHGLAAWPSWPVAIDTYTEGLARVYDTDNVDESMARKYVPPNWQKWLRTVHWVMDDI